ICTDAEHNKIISGYILSPLRLRRLIRPGSANPHQSTPSLESCKVGKARSVVAKSLVLVVGEERPVVLHAAVDAAVFFVTNAIKFARFRHRQRAQQDSVHECED